MPLRGPLLALGLATFASLATSAPNTGMLATGTAAPAWTEVKWPFLLDQWGTGRAFQCPAADCGTEVNVYVRPKLGFCNCTTGVSDDDEIDRVGDIDLVGNRFAPLAQGRPVTVGWMNGRSRPYAVESPHAPPRSALAIAFNDKCDVIVATVVAEHARLPKAERVALDFLNSKLVLRWAEVQLGL